jgi:hypothetical protein
VPDDVEAKAKHKDLWTAASIVISNIQQFEVSALERKNNYDNRGFSIVHKADKIDAAVRLNDAIMLSLFGDKFPENVDNWPAWRHSYAYMEWLRSVLANVTETRADDSIVTAMIPDARKVWSDLLDVYCEELPGEAYEDLEGKQRACPAKQ